jgi:hypothetical protein
MFLIETDMNQKVIADGIVKSSEYLDWKITVVDDTDGATGGFYLLLSGSDKNSQYDYWFENLVMLKNQLNEFTVDWRIGAELL